MMYETQYNHASTTFHPSAFELILPHKKLMLSTFKSQTKIMNQFSSIHSKMVDKNFPVMEEEKSCLDIVLENQMAALNIQKKEMIKSLTECQDSGSQYLFRPCRILSPRRVNSNIVRKYPGSFVVDDTKRLVINRNEKI